MCKTLVNKVLFAFILTACLFISCGEESKMLDGDQFGYQYFPLEADKYWIYSVDKTTVDDAGATIIDESVFVKEEITEKFADSAGDTLFRLQRSESSTQNGVYTITDVWTASKSSELAIRTEENLRFVKMIYPISVGTSWEGNQFDELIEVFVADEKVQVYKDWGDYECVAKGISLSAGGTAYEDVLSIEQGNFNSDIERRYAIEHYAPDIGMIKKEMIILDTQCICPGEEWIEKAEKGFTLTMELVEHN